MDRPGGRGQYDEEYQRCPCFWGTQPAKYVRLLADKTIPLSGARALDLGAGEGKNAFFLHSLGYQVTAVEISRFACANFLQRMIAEDVDEGMTLILGNALEASVGPPSSYDLVVAYGLLHCLPTRTYVDVLITIIQALTRVGGINIVSAFTDRLPVPDVQDYLSPTLLPEDYIITRYKNWEIMSYENDVLTETHPTTSIEHQHSLFRLMARRNE